METAKYIVYEQICENLVSHDEFLTNSLSNVLKYFKELHDINLRINSPFAETREDLQNLYDGLENKYLCISDIFSRLPELSELLSRPLSINHSILLESSLGALKREVISFQRKYQRYETQVIDNLKKGTRYSYFASNWDRR